MTLKELVKDIIKENNKLARKIEVLYRANPFCKQQTEKFDFYLSKAILDPQVATQKELFFQQRMINLLFNQYLKESGANIEIKHAFLNIDGFASPDSFILSK